LSGLIFSSMLTILASDYLPYVEVKTEVDSFDERDSGDKSAAAFTVLLHGSLKVEQMVALVQIVFVFFSLKPLLCNGSYFRCICACTFFLNDRGIFSLSMG